MKSTMEWLKSLIREPAILFQLVENLIAVLVILNIRVSHDQEATVMAVIIAVNALVKGIATKPFAVHFVTDLARALLLCGIAFGLNLTADKATVIVTFVGTVTALIGSIRTTPAYDPVAAVGGAGGGPVYGELGVGAPESKLGGRGHRHTEPRKKP